MPTSPTPPSLRQVSVGKQVWKEPFTTFHRKRQANRGLRGCGRQVSGRSQFAERVAGRSLGGLEHDLRVAALQCAMSQDGGDQVGRAPVINRIFDKAPVTLLQSIEVKQLRGKRDLVARDLEEPLAEGLQCRLGKVAAPVTISAPGTVRVVHHSLVLAAVGLPTGQAAGDRPQSLAANARGERHRV